MELHPESVPLARSEPVRQFGELPSMFLIRWTEWRVKESTDTPVGIGGVPGSSGEDERAGAGRAGCKAEVAVPL